MKKRQRKIIIWLTILAILPASILGTYLYKEYKRKALYEDTIDFFYEHREEFEKAIEQCNELDVYSITDNYNSDSSLKKEKCGDYCIYYKKGADNTESKQAIEELSKLLKLFSKNVLESVTNQYSNNQEHINSYIFFYEGFFKQTWVSLVYTGHSPNYNIYNRMIDEPDRITIIDDDWVIFEKEYDNNPQY